MGRIVVLWSGGVDSTVLLYGYAQNPVYSEIYPLTFNYGQAAFEAEQCARNKLLQNLFNGNPEHARKIQDRMLFNVDFPGKNFLTGGEPEEYAEGYHSEIVPGRNTIFMMMGYHYARSLKADSVAIGIRNIDNPSDEEKLFPDCSPLWFDYIYGLFNNENKTCKDSPRVLPYAPLLYRNKRWIVEEAKNLAIRTQDTLSCHFPVQTPFEWVRCGICEGCVSGKEAGLHE